MIGIHSFADAQRGVVAECDGEDECLTVGVFALGYCERGRDDRRSGVECGAFVNVVQLEDV